MAVFGIILGFVVGAGVGAFNAEHLKPCLMDTFHLTRQSAVPVAKNLSQKVSEKSAPYMKMAQ
eukprot:CAMPEP_0117600282 /NCGR_PEP_ID=MMETSP0784-20121206/76404_1 /TAXON_ID=39447 /ORGANISM="" /LENGTH=62 /DNA_ID=CAMNT_0005402903 /DNA_START=91 /DNA_END=276 /DNA_ORIENTATION=+